MKTVVMIRLNDSPQCDMRIALQKKSLEKAGYDVHQLFLNYVNGLNILQIHKNKETTWKETENVSYAQSYYREVMTRYTFLKPLKKYLVRNMEYEAILSLIKHVDIIHANNFDTMILALKLKKHFKCKVIYDMQEYYAKMDAQDFKSITLAWYLWLDKYACKRADWIFVTDMNAYRTIDNFINGDGKL
jgi:hypothetical protein